MTRAVHACYAYDSESMLTMLCHTLHAETASVNTGLYNFPYFMNTAPMA